MECNPQGIYRPRNAQATDLYRLVEDNFEELERVWDDRYERQHGFWRPMKIISLIDNPAVIE